MSSLEINKQKNRTSTSLHTRSSSIRGPMGTPPSSRLLLLTRAVNVSQAPTCSRLTSEDPPDEIYSIFNYFILMTTAKLRCRKLDLNLNHRNSDYSFQDELSIQTSSKISLIFDSMMLLLSKGHLTAIYSSAQGSVNNNKNNNKKACNLVIQLRHTLPSWTYVIRNTGSSAHSCQVRASSFHKHCGLASCAAESRTRFPSQGEHLLLSRFLRSFTHE